jgi:hypothetical protein
MLSNDAKVAVLCSALEHVEAANDWGVFSPEESADYASGLMLIDIGTDALPLLKKLLSDNRQVRLYGSRPSTISVKYKYRRKDYAYRYICMILGRGHSFDAEPEMRDKAIEQLLKHWKKE